MSLLKCFRLLKRLKGTVCVLPKGWFPHGSLKFDILARLYCHRYITIEHLRAEPLPTKSSSRYLKGLLPGLGIWWYIKMISSKLRWIGPHLIVCVSESVRRGLIDLYNFPERKLITIHNGVETDKYYFNEKTRISLRKKWNISDSAFIYGFVGRLETQKNLNLAINCFNKIILSDESFNAYFVIIGEGSCLKELQILVNSYGLNERILFSGYTKKPWKVYSAIDIFLLPSLNEGLPLALIEAMSSECCAIATNVGGVPEVITDDSLGWLIPQGDQEAFLKAMKEAFHLDLGSLKKMGFKARSHIKDKFNSKQQLNVLSEVIEKSCGLKI